MPEPDLMRVRADIGMLFQESALFDSLTVSENVGYRLDEETDMPADEAQRRVEEVLGFVGLGEYIERMPSELSGGQRRRVAIARAMASKPHLLLFDDPTTGSIRSSPRRSTTRSSSCATSNTSRRSSSRTRSGTRSTSRRTRPIRTNDHLQIVAADAAKAERAEFMVLHEGRILFEGSGAELLASPDAYLKEFLYMTLPPW